jgi:hypothetical protein
MTTPDDDRTIDGQVRAAAEVAFDDIRVAEAVLARVHRLQPPAAARPGLPRPSSARPSPARWIGPLAFASILAATPFLVARLPVTDEALILGLAAGNPGVVLGGSFAGGAFLR